MRKLLLLIALLWGSAALAQTTAVTATITDSDGTAWANGTYSISFIAPPGNNSPPIYNGSPMTQAQKGPYTGTLNGSGTLSVSLPDNVFISPAGSVWKFVICPNASAACSQINQAVTGSSQNFTSQFSALVTAPRFAATPNSYGYNTTEITVVPVPGGSFYNVTLACPYIWSGSAWACGGGGGTNAPGTNGPMPEFASYTFYVNSGTVYARNNLTGALDFSGADVAVVVNSVLTANATVGGHLYFKNGVYPVNSLTAETATGCSNFGGSGNLLAYAFGIPAAASYQTGVHWVVEGETSTVWTGELLATTVAATGVVFNVTPTAVSSVAANSVLAGFWQRPFTNCTLTTAVSNNNANDLFFKNVTVRFPVNTRGNEIPFAAYFAGTVQYENDLADFNVGYNTIATGAAPTVGSYNSIGFTTTTSGSGNWEDFRNSYAVGYNIGYDFQSEHVTGTTVTAIYNNIACEFGRSAGAVFHPSKIDNFIDQENGAGCIWGNQIQQGTFFDIYFDFELGNDANWYSTARAKATKLSEVNNGYATGLIRYQAVLQNAGVVAEVPALSLFSSGGVGFQEIEATQNPNLQIIPSYDAFTRPNTTPAAASNGLGPAWLGGTQAGNHNLKIVSNSAQVTDTGIQSGYSTYLATSFNPDQFSRATCSILVAAANFCEVTVRNSTNPAVQTYYTYYNGGTAAAGRGIIRVVAGVSTTLASQTASAGAAGDTIEVDVVGSTLWAYRNGALDTSFTPNPVIDANITSGNPGINLVQAATNGVAITNWLGGNFPTKTGTDSIYNNPGYHTTYNTTTNCAVNTASPAACGSAAAGVIVVPTTTTTYTVNTTAVTASSRIFLMPINDNTGIPSSPTCTTLAVTSVLMPASRVAGASFTFNIPSTVGASCVEYWIVN